MLYRLPGRPVAVLLAAALLYGLNGTAARELPRVRLVATGGTISNRAGGRLTAEELLQSVPNLGQYVRAESEQFSNVPSSAITLDQWLKLSRRISEMFDTDAGLGGIVVTSGTDMLEEIAYFLHLTVRHHRPIVLVGSMRNPSTLGYEGAANLLQGFRVAAEPAARGKGVLVVLNDEINSAREATKTDALRLQTFQSRGYGVLGVVDADRVVFYRDVVKRHTARSEFDLQGIAALPRVDIIMVYQDAAGDLIKAAVDSGASGIVMATGGAGATSGTQPEAMAWAAGRGVPIVLSTRTGAGRVIQRDSPARTLSVDPASSADQPRPTSSYIGGEDLTPLKARILLMLALTRTRSDLEIARMFTEY